VGWTAHFIDAEGHPVSDPLIGTATSSNLVNGQLVITAPSDNVYLDYIDFTAGADTSVRLTSVNAYTLDTSITKTLDFGFTATDADGDHVGGTFSLLAQNSATLTGTADNDALGGGSGANIITGGAGNDTLTGGTGADTFKVSDGQDHITDYSQAEGDKIEIAAGDSYSKVLDDNGYAKLVITDGAIEKSITFDTISYNTLDTTHGDQALLDSLLDQVNHN
jgi:Ca2+-binding RTX toxin-like protein